MAISAHPRQDLGGGLSVPLRELTPATVPSDRARKTLRPSRRAEDTSAGCRANAAADLARAASGPEQFRWRLEHSATAWTKRAQLLERLEVEFEKRRVSKGQ